MVEVIPMKEESKHWSVKGLGLHGMERHGGKLKAGQPVSIDGTRIQAYLVVQHQGI
jgi:hypothetical protein